MATVTALLDRPDLVVVVLPAAAVVCHVLVRVLRHRHRLGWAELGRVVEADVATPRALSVQAALLLTLVAGLLPPEGPHWPFAAAFAALAGSCGWATVPILRDAVRELAEMVTGAALPVERARPAPDEGPAGTLIAG